MLSHDGRHNLTMSIDDTTYEGDRTSITFRPVSYSIRWLWPFLVAGFIVYLTIHPGKATHGTVVQADVLAAVIGVVMWVYLARYWITITRDRLELGRVRSVTTLSWVELRDIKSGFLGCTLSTSDGKKIHVIGILHRGRFDNLRGSLPARQTVAWLLKLSHGTPEYREAQIHNGVPTGFP